MRRITSAATGVLVAGSVVVLAGVALAGDDVGTAAASGVTTAIQQERPGPDSARVASLFASLRRTDPVVCEMISDQMGNFWWDDGGSTVGRLVDTRRDVRAAKLDVSSRVRDPRTISLLSAELSADDPCVRFVAAKMLGDSEVSEAQLTTLLGAASARIQEGALRAAGERERPALRPRVERMLESGSDAAVRAMAAWVLGEYEQRASVTPLTRALGSDDARVRAAAAWALGAIEDPSAAPALDRAVAQETSREVRLEAIRALGSLDGLRLPPRSLVAAASDTDANVRRAALEALTDFDDPGLAPLYLAVITDPDPDVRVMAIEMLGELGAREAVSALTRALRDPVAEVRRAAVEALAEIDEDH